MNLQTPFRMPLAPLVLLSIVSGHVLGEDLGEETDPRPNIVFAIADDWGWPHAGAYGDRVVQTPVFDRLAREGVLFHHAFVSSPSCKAAVSLKTHWATSG